VKKMKMMLAYYLYRRRCLRTACDEQEVCCL
jgi:hypothetical protein